jgi:hypothetical protein
MPFTPFHMGPAAALKAISGPCFSLEGFLVSPGCKELGHKL